MLNQVLNRYKSFSSGPFQWVAKHIKMKWGPKFAWIDTLFKTRTCSALAPCLGEGQTREDRDDTGGRAGRTRAKAPLLFSPSPYSGLLTGHIPQFRLYLKRRLFLTCTKPREGYPLKLCTVLCVHQRWESVALDQRGREGEHQREEAPTSWTATASSGRVPGLQANQVFRCMCLSCSLI